MKRILPRLGLCVFVVAAVILPACSSYKKNNNNNGNPITVTITNKISSIVAASAAITINASVQNDTYTAGVSWTLTAAGMACSPACGALSNQTTTSVTYTPPPTVPNGAAASPVITATSITDATKSDTDSFTITATGAIIVTITNKISAINAGANTVTFTANAQNDTLGGGVTWALVVNGSDCQPACGTLSNQTSTSVDYAPPGSVPASPDNAPTLIATAVDDTSKTDSDTFTITNNGAVNGQYAFLIQGFDDATGAQFAYIGSLTADGNGNITGGVEDVNLPGGLQSAVPITGTYAVGGDNRGTATINTATGSNTFAFSAGTFNNSGIATKLDVIEFDDSTGTGGRRGSGHAYLQDSTAFSLASISGPYAFEFTGQDGGTAGARIADIGTVTVSSGAATGSIDSNSSGTPATSAFTATIAATTQTSSSGRFAFTLSLAASPTSVIYVVNAGHALSMDISTITSSGLTSGEIQTQSSASFSNADLNGNLVFFASGLSSTAGKSSSAAGVFNFNSATATGSVVLGDSNDGGTASSVTGTFNYSVAANGKVTFSGGGISGLSLPDMYLIGPNHAVFITEGNDVSAGLALPQSAGPFGVTSVNGSYFFGDAVGAPAAADAVTSGVATSSGGGSVSATSDLSAPASPFLTPSQSLTLTLTLTDATNGRFTDSNGDVVYVISSTQFVFFDASGNNPRVIFAEQ